MFSYLIPRIVYRKKNIMQQLKNVLLDYIVDVINVYNNNNNNSIYIFLIFLHQIVLYFHVYHVTYINIVANYNAIQAK